MWHDTKPKFDSSILQSVGGTGKAFAYLGQSLTDVDKQNKDEQKTKATLDLQNKELGLKEKQVNIQDKAYADAKEKETKAEVDKTAENSAKVKTMREYLTKQGIDTKSYTDSDILYAGDNIEKIHTDKSDLKFSQFVYNNKTPYAVYKDKNDNLVTKPLFENSGQGGQSDKKNKDNALSHEEVQNLGEGITKNKKIIKSQKEGFGDNGYSNIEEFNKELNAKFKF